MSSIRWRNEFDMVSAGDGLYLIYNDISDGDNSSPKQVLVYKYSTGSGKIKIRNGTLYLLRNGGPNANEMYIYDLTRSDSAWKKVGDNS